MSNVVEWLLFGGVGVVVGLGAGFGLGKASARAEVRKGKSSAGSGAAGSIDLRKSFVSQTAGVVTAFLWARELDRKGGPSYDGERILGAYWSSSSGSSGPPPSVVKWVDRQLTAWESHSGGWSWAKEQIAMGGANRRLIDLAYLWALEMLEPPGVEALVAVSPKYPAVPVVELPKVKFRFTSADLRRR